MQMTYETISNRWVLYYLHCMVLKLTWFVFTPFLRFQDTIFEDGYFPNKTTTEKNQCSSVWIEKNRYSTHTFNYVKLRPCFRLKLAYSAVCLLLNQCKELNQFILRTLFFFSCTFHKFLVIYSRPPLICLTQ